MNENQQSPPRVALWLLRNAYLGSDGEALTGDLLELFVAEGRSSVWFWRQTGVAMAANLPGAAVSLVKTGVLAALLTAAVITLRVGHLEPPPPNSYGLWLEPFCTFLIAAWFGCRARRDHSHREFA